MENLRLGTFGDVFGVSTLHTFRSYCCGMACYTKTLQEPAPPRILEVTLGLLIPLESDFFAVPVGPPPNHRWNTDLGSLTASGEAWGRRCFQCALRSGVKRSRGDWALGEHRPGTQECRGVHHRVEWFSIKHIQNNSRTTKRFEHTQSMFFGHVSFGHCI